MIFWTSNVKSGCNTKPVVLPDVVGNMSVATFLKFILAPGIIFDFVDFQFTHYYFAKDNIDAVF